ncbi:XdhC family protein [Schlegelella sp. S2-27]|uniref:XdhC family protein n=1 Tax=Caldimonas mangrovi TaxID=2944811 RepID=A0ABT0YRN4_9BURK|nr:XdhC family protein [Caldimonas mangrovi]MCM5681413.1 XdhC family protein [Caldimonas mangrovi]
MENLDVLVLRTLRDWRLERRPALLVTVVRTWGSSPRPVGSVMALARHGAVVGSVSGGCIEDDLMHRYCDPRGDLHAEHGAPRRLTYGVGADEAHRFGLPCGGTIELLVEFDPGASGLSELVRRLESGRLVQRRVQLRDGAASLHDTPVVQALHEDGTVLTAVFGPEYRMFLIGGGHLSGCLATMASFSGFAVTVCDPRTVHQSGLPPQARLVAAMPDDALSDFRPDRRTCVVALTHDPKLDDLALLAALESEAFYVGAIGSRRNSLARRERLATHFQVPEAQLARLRGPVGLSIGSKTPAEIAISIMADVVAARNGVTLPKSMAIGLARNGASCT